MIDFPQWQRLGVGTAQFGNLGHPVSDADAEAVVETAWAEGLRYFDTAPHYGLGLAERRLGRALAARPREEYLLSTKVGRLLVDNPNPVGSDEENGFLVPDELTRERDYTADGVRRSLAESLTRLGIDRIDIALIHDPDEPDDRFAEARDGAVPALRELKEQGVIRAWGVGTKDPEMAKRFVDQCDPDVVMLAGRYTLLEQESVGLLAACAGNDVGVIAVGVFNSGLLATDDPGADARYEYGPVPGPQLERARRLAAVTAEFGVPLPAAAIAYVKRNPTVVNVCLGMSNAQQVRDDIALDQVAVPDELWAELARQGLLDATFIE
ncbi:D-threo-aldose 1-dehydrogenase [Propionibacteriaceae bacterium ES.041]|uniref:aldo/keto reductase n=1 Tax=Enemella evansiae TaxID=2016499 RepID=UPI000B975FA4|nr:aldo/keto reductase [Enemella evansiae]OYN99461.1 aldo/keto reductase [Enemella evansiae]OYO12293.1 aldo/keto reductase [Enemella evansiae]OYO16004.1 aldo/keto reductase [Enemella evansiae]PFG65291.1 D-threo-aldose 1-dehydrogenase [Propionibacteriaceae bacterium ES.041]